MSNDYTLEGETITRKSDGKKVATYKDGKLKLAAPAFGKIKPELEALLEAREEGSHEASGQSPVIVETPEKVNRTPLFRKQTYNPADWPQDETPRELFSKRLGDMTPEVIEWRRENWPAEQLQDKYKGRI